MDEPDGRTNDTTISLAVGTHGSWCLVNDVCTARVNHKLTEKKGGGEGGGGGMEEKKESLSEKSADYYVQQLQANQAASQLHDRLVSVPGRLYIV